jgi:hypothetical protein
MYFLLHYQIFSDIFLWSIVVDKPPTTTTTTTTTCPTDASDGGVVVRVVDKIVATGTPDCDLWLFVVDKATCG